MLAIMKAHEGDVVELAEDLPKYGRRRSDRGTVIEAFDHPNEAYDVEFEDAEGEFLGFAYSVRPDQIINVDAAAKEAFERGLELVHRGKQAEAEREFRRAVKIKPEYAGVLHNSIVRSFESSEDWQRRISAMRIVLRVAPDYQIARDNLAIAFLKHGVEKASEGDLESSRELYHLALSVGPSPEIAVDLQRNIAAAYTGLGLRAHEEGEFERAHMYLRDASAVHPTNQTLHNLALACASLAFWLMDQGRIDEAIEGLERAQDGGLITPRLLNDYAVALVHSGRIDDAIVALERALEIEPNNDTIQTNLATIRSNPRGLLRPEEIPFAFYAPPPMESRDYLAA